VLKVRRELQEPKVHEVPKELREFKVLLVLVLKVLKVLLVLEHKVRKEPSVYRVQQALVEHQSTTRTMFQKVR
jgi:hypothetical protein